jgi:hypothetical protein
MHKTISGLFDQASAERTSDESVMRFLFSTKSNNTNMKTKVAAADANTISQRMGVAFFSGGVALVSINLWVSVFSTSTFAFS